MKQKISPEHILRGCLETRETCAFLTDKPCSIATHFKVRLYNENMTAVGYQAKKLKCKTEEKVTVLQISF